MKLEEIARALGVPTLEEVAAAHGVSVESIRPASPEPCLVLDFRGDEGARRWDRMAKAPIETKGIVRRGLDPWTGVPKAKKARRR